MLTVEFSGRQFTVILPEGSAPGMQLQVNVPEAEDDSVQQEETPTMACTADEAPVRGEVAAAEPKSGAMPTAAAADDDFEDSMDEKDFEAFMNEPDSDDDSPPVRAAPPSVKASETAAPAPAAAAPPVAPGAPAAPAALR